MSSISQRFVKNIILSFVTETHQALELLGDYYSSLTKSEEKQLVIETERLIRVLKSRFFQALIGKSNYDCLYCD